ncbi:MAG: ribulose-phosphate 3-epimerase [Bacilli bacterium]|nr:ribulose-phosphate 3-epimerase [Bacilli bacterium]
MIDLSKIKYPAISPSLLSASKDRMDEELSIAMKAEAPFIHIDIMDGIFVPNVSLSIKFVGDIKPKHNMISDVHIMVADPINWVEGLVKNGADIITFHYEACSTKEEILGLIDLIHKNNVLCGISIKPNTPVEVLLPFINLVDIVLLMSVEPGKGGQKFIESSLERMESIRKMIRDNKSKALIEVDGGINNETAPKALNNGADILVAGSYLFGHEDFVERAKGLINGN